MILASDEEELTLLKVLKTLHEILPERTFYGNAGPSVIMTDNCNELRNALKKKVSKFMLVTLHLSYATTSLALVLRSIT